MKDKKILHCVPVNKNLAIKYSEGDRWMTVVPNPYEACKAYVLARAEGKLDKYIPMKIEMIPELGFAFVETSEHIKNLEHYMTAFTDDNSPGAVRFSGNPTLFRDIIEPLDFSRRIASETINSIRSKFIGASRKKTEVDAVEIAEAENA